MNGDEETRTDWPIGPALRQARERAGLSVREAARRTAPPNGKPTVSAGRWHQLESGWQKNKSVLIPIGTTAATIAAAARAIGWDTDEALRIAGFTPADMPSPAVTQAAGIESYSDDELLAEVRKRMRPAIEPAHDRPPLRAVARTERQKAGQNAIDAQDAAAEAGDSGPDGGIIPTL